MKGARQRRVELGSYKVLATPISQQEEAADDSGTDAERDGHSRFDGDDPRDDADDSTASHGNAH